MLKHLYPNLEEKYDYIFRTNASTYINLPLLQEFINKRVDSQKVYAPIIYSTQEQGPFKYGIFPQGNGMLFSTSLIKYMINTPEFNIRYCLDKYPLSVKTNNMNAGTCDDGTIGYMLCCHFCDEGKNIFDCFSEFGCFKSKNLYGIDDTYNNITADDFSKCICISYRDIVNKNRDDELKMNDFIHQKLKNGNCTDLSLIDEWLSKDYIHLHIPNFIDREITKKEAISILKYNDYFQQIPYVFINS